MTTHTQPPTARDSRTGPVVTALVESGLVEPTRRDEAVVVVDQALAAQQTTPSSLRNRFAELAGYLGGALVVSAAGIFVTAQWGSLAEGQRVGLLAGTAAVLGVAAAMLAFTGRGVAALRTEGGAARRRRRPAVHGSGRCHIHGGGSGDGTQSLHR